MRYLEPLFKSLFFFISGLIMLEKTVLSMTVPRLCLMSRTTSCVCPPWTMYMEAQVLRLAGRRERLEQMQKDYRNNPCHVVMSLLFGTGIFNRI